MKLTKKLLRLSLLMMTLCLLWPSIGMSSEQDSAACESLLIKCSKVVQEQKEAIDGMKQARIVRETIIVKQEQELERLEEDNKELKKTFTWSGVLAVLLLLL